MKIAVFNHTSRKVGGIEQNLSAVLPELERRGHRLALFFTTESPADRDLITLGPCTLTSDVANLQDLRDFAPDIINVRGDIDPVLESQLLDAAPTAYSVHNYHGTCVGGHKATSFPVIQPCTRTFGKACLAHYFPQRCGGLSPLTMWHRYRHEAKRLHNLKRYSAIITHSAHMQSEYLQHGIDPSRLHRIPYEVTQSAAPFPSTAPPIEEQVNLLFIGRMEARKGGEMLLRALPAIQARLGRPVQLTLAGDGPDRNLWESITQKSPISITFTGWLDAARMSEAFAHTHLLVVPSLWPEPFGKVGPEAGLHSVPAAAFDVGGVREWLSPGLNGFLANALPPTSESLAAAVTRCTQHPATHRGLRAGAREASQRFPLGNHVDHLLGIFESVRKTRSHAA